MSTMPNAWAGLLAMIVAALAAAADPAHDHRMRAERAPAAAGAFQSAMDAGMSKMMKDMHAPGYTGNADVDFLAMMIPHHEGAVEMARLLLIHGADPATRRLAEDIIASQQVEIAGMRRRLEQLRGGTEAMQPDGFPALGGTRGIAPAR